MSNIHSYHIDKLKTNFENIMTLKQEIIKTKLSVADKLSQLKVLYNDLVKTNKKKIFLFCLDSFYFQYKSFAMEMDNIDRFRVLMNNRMYCDYYKLYCIIVSDIKENKFDIVMDNFEMKTFPVYKDLEPFQEYKMEDIRDIHTNILYILNELYNQSLIKKENIDHYNENHRIGFSISNFINTLEYENNLLQQQISLYMNYISFFHISQKKQLSRLFHRMNDFYKEVEENININRTFSIHDIEDSQKLNRFYVIGDEIQIESLLEDSEYIIQNSEKVVQKIDTILQFESSSPTIETIDISLEQFDADLDVEDTTNENQENPNQNQDNPNL